MSQLQLSLLGTPVVKHGERTLTFSTRKALALLVYLAVEGGMHTRKTLSESFWPELDAEHGRAALRATLLELRKLLERCHEPGEQSHLHIERDTLGIEHASQPILDIRWPRAWLAVLSWQASHCATRNFSTTGRANNESTAICAYTICLMPCRCCMNGREMGSEPSRP